MVQGLQQGRAHSKDVLQQEEGSDSWKGQPTHKLKVHHHLESSRTTGSFHTTENYSSLEGKELHMEVDTGASLSLINETMFKALWDADDTPSIQQTEVKLWTYTGQKIHLLESITVTAETSGQQARLPLLVGEGSGPSHLGRNWSAKLHLAWKEIISVCPSSILEQHQEVFEPGLGTIKGVEAKLYIDLQA